MVEYYRSAFDQMVGHGDLEFLVGGAVSWIGRFLFGLGSLKLWRSPFHNIFSINQLFLLLR
jgi:hypothetical protein